MVKGSELNHLRKWMGGESAPPTSIEISPTLKCNLNCAFCWRRAPGARKDSEELSLRTYQRIFKEARDLGVKEVRVIGGGEPLLRPDAYKILEAIKQNKLYGYLCTNGTLLSPEAIIKMGWDYVKVSVHGTRTVHNGLVGAEVFGKVVGNLRDLSNMRKLKKVRISRSKKPEVELGMVLTNKNHHLIGEMIDLCAYVGADAFFVEPITVYSRKGNGLTLKENHKKEFITGLKGWIEKSKEAGIKTNLKDFLEFPLLLETGDMREYMESRITNSRFSLACYEPFLRIGIRTDGKVGPCGFYDTGTFENSRKKSLKEVWYGKYMEKRREQHLRKIIPEYCNKCCTTLVMNNERIRRALCGGLKKEN